jgi:hypothetical protein
MGIDHKLRTGIPKDVSDAPAFSSAREGVRSASDFSRPKPNALSRVTNKEEWGERTATERYRLGTTRVAPPKDAHRPQRLGDPNNQQDAGYDNDVPESSWLRGGGKAGEGKPGFDVGHRAPRGDEAATSRKSPRDTWYKVPGNKKLRDLGDY